MNRDAARIVMTIIAAAWLTSGPLATAARAFVGEGEQALAPAASPVPAPIVQAGCYRLGLSGYHWYHFCVGPGFLYPHHRICHYGHCYYR